MPSNNQPPRNYNRLAISIVVAAVIIGAAILDSSTLHRTVTSTSTATSTKTNAATETQTQTTTLIQAVTSTATSTRTSTATATATVTSTSTSTATSTTTSLSQSTTTVTEFGTPSIGVITADNITIGKPNSEFRGVAADDLTDMIYVPGPSNVTVISTDTNSVVGAIAIKGGSSLVAVNPQTNMIYANNYSCFTASCTQSLDVINGTSNQLIGTIDLGQYVNGIDVDYNTNLIYATSILPGSLYIINGTTDALVAKVAFPGSPQGFSSAWGVAVDENTNMVYVPTCISTLVCAPDTVYEIAGATGSIVAQIPLRESGIPLAIAVDSYTDTVYVTMQGSALVSINASTNAETVNIISALSLSCYGLVTTGDEIYLSCSARPDIPSFIVIDAENNAIINSFTQAGSPMDVTFGYGFPRAAIYIVNQNGYVLAVLSTSSTLP